MNQQPNNTEVIEEEVLQGEEQVMQSVRTSRILIPMFIGLGVVAYMLYANWDADAFASIKWDTHKFTWIGLAIAFVVIRHLAYTLRLRILSDKFFSWKKCVELIFIWEFSSAISPTSVGGAAVSLFVLAQEKLGAAKTTALILYTIVIDTLFFLSFISYSMMGLMPGDPLDIACQANPYCTPDNLEQMKKNLGLDQPVYVRYIKWLGSFVQGDLGFSRT
ncbi:MAG: hypothetical protein ACPG5P_05900, partial [Saprospiraceae bacterium]